MAVHRRDAHKSGALDWVAEQGTWPHADASGFYEAGGLRWHVQQMGQGPSVVLVHGTGASTHSWRRLAPLLAERFRVIAPDLPGHGFTERASGQRLSLPAMAAGLAALVKRLQVRPLLVVGHSAGAAILIRCCLDGGLQPNSVISLNGALLPFRGAAGLLFPPLAKLLFLNPLTPRLFARSAGDRQRVVRLIRGTGSELDEAGIELYARLFSSSAHVAATLGMMANWDLHRFARDLPDLKVPLDLLIGEKDKAVPPSEAKRICQIVAGARLHHLPNLGHLAHEEDPGTIAQWIVQLALESSASKPC